MLKLLSVWYYYILNTGMCFARDMVSIHCGVTSNLRIGLARRTRIGMKRIYVLQNNLTPSCRHSLKLNLEFPIMEIKLRHRVWRDLSNILFAEVKGPGLNSYRTTSIRLMLTVMRRIGWVQHKHISHFEMVLWQNATDATDATATSIKSFNATSNREWQRRI